MRVTLRSGPPEAKDRAEVVFEKLGSRHVLAAFPKVNLGPVLESGRLRGGWSLEASRLPAESALDLLFVDVGIDPCGLARRTGVAALLKPEVVVPDVASFPETHLMVFPED